MNDKKLQDYLKKFFNGKPQDDKKPKQPRARRTNLRASKIKWGKFNFGAIGLALLVLGAFVHLQFPQTGTVIAWLGAAAALASIFRRLNKSFRNGWLLATWLAGLFFLVFMGILFCFSAHIYAEMGRSISPSQGVLEIGGLGADAARSIPAVGPILAMLLSLLASLISSAELTLWGLFGVLAFVVIQTLEVLPIVLKASPEIMKSLVAQLEQFKKLDAPSSASDTVLLIVDEHNDYYEGFFRALSLARLGAYAIDLFVCTLHAPIIDGGYGFWSVARLTLGWGSFDWANIVRIFITLGFFEFVVRCAVWVGKTRYLVSGSAAKA